MYQAPAYFVYILSGFCFKQSKFATLNFLKVSLVVTGIFMISFGPFNQEIMQVLSRLFPFKRGLCHAYWAPNIWAIYSFIDRILVWVFKLLGNPISNGSHSTRLFALIQRTSRRFQLCHFTQCATYYYFLGYSYHPIGFLSLTQPSLWKIWKEPSPTNFLKGLVLCGYSSFLFGWHVHEVVYFYLESNSHGIDPIIIFGFDGSPSIKVLFHSLFCRYLLTISSSI
jgi:alpha-1,3-glucosyltransferase